MKRISNNIENTIIIKNSKFITNLFIVENIEEVNKYLNLIKDKYKDANHNCYAYIVDNIRKCSDDGEPNGTAGIPIMKVLEHKDLNNVLAVVTRYFGGIKLGAGGLVRAYTNSVSKALDIVNIIDTIKGYNIDIIFNFNDIKHIDYLLKDIKILNKEYKDIVKYNLNASNNLLEILKKNNIKYNIIKEIYIEKNINN